MDLEVKIKDKNTIFSRTILGQVGVMSNVLCTVSNSFFFCYYMKILIGLEQWYFSLI